MMTRLGRVAFDWVSQGNPWTNVYGFSRSLIALATAMTLAFNDASVFFRPAAGILTYPNRGALPGIFNMVPASYTYLNVVRWVCVVILLLVASGWRPRITCVLHWWISYSLFTSAITIDGGEQVATVMTLLLLPIALTDNRKWHWQTPADTLTIRNDEVLRRIVAYVTLTAIRVQVAIIYFNSTVAKLAQPEWIDGTAVYYYLNDPMLGLPSLLKNALNPILTSSAVVIPTWGTLILQTCLFAALFAPKSTWKYFLRAALLFHESIALMLGLVSFSLIMVASLVLFLHPAEKPFLWPDRFWSLLLRRTNLIFRRSEHAESSM
ncbi:hypothetical protein CVV65_05530 [Kyrpidia spormannii]|uniref:HTTM-like domain-containing protein n=1 Tax=Kyrpidia spormannii TaxID=2055160 RepID=A0A2K8N585_9BACL|nr:sporulation-delaying protein SdpB family protein [Kyrpidia spormannii]ATY84483.1 hypothetical protein CVV65_05530 [Kyrpidia spormannii]